MRESFIQPPAFRRPRKQHQKDKDPEVWLKEEYKNEQAIEEYKRRNYIDPTLKLEWENIKEFRKKREEAIIERLKEVLLPKS